MPLYEITRSTISYLTCVIDAKDRETAERLAQSVNFDDCFREESCAELMEDHTWELTDEEYEDYDKNYFPIFVENDKGHIIKK